jgi:hypothetical protein
MYAVRTYLRMTRTPLLWVFQSLWSYVLTTATLMVFLILGLGQWMFELEHTISMFDSFLCGCCRLSVSCDFFFPGRAAVNHAVGLVYTIPGAVSCPYSTGYLSAIGSNLGSGYQRDYEPGHTDERWHSWSSSALGIILFYVILQPPFIFAPL